MLNEIFMMETERSFMLCELKACKSFVKVTLNKFYIVNFKKETKMPLSLSKFFFSQALVFHFSLSLE
jgi:hypothetical protein